LSSRRTGRSS